MRYPKHLILDIKTTPTITNNYIWSLNFLNQTQRKSKFKLPPKAMWKRATAKPIYVKALKFSSTDLSYFYECFDIHFLRKEKIYTKLKYSRCPQYDIVSGGFAALFAGFIGFLISEKFGLELVDSGDFYVAFMYLVFIILSLKVFLDIYSKDDTLYTPLSIKYFLYFYQEFFTLLLKEVRFTYTKIRNRFF